MLLDYASIILGIIGVPERQELCWHIRYTFLISWPNIANLQTLSIKCTVALLPVHVTSICPQQESSFGGLHTTFSNTKIQPLRKVRILIVTTFKLSYVMCICMKSS